MCMTVVHPILSACVTGKVSMTYCRAGFLYGFYFSKLTCLLFTRFSSLVLRIHYYDTKIMITILKLNPNLNLKYMYEILS